MPLKVAKASFVLELQQSLLKPPSSCGTLLWSRKPEEFTLRKDRPAFSLRGHCRKGGTIDLSSRSLMILDPVKRLPEVASLWPEVNEGHLYVDKVKARHVKDGLALLSFYTQHHTSSASQEGWRQRIANGQITVDGVVVTDPDVFLKENSILGYRRLPWQEPSAPCSLEIVFEDDHILALNKPPGLQVLPGGPFQQRTVLTLLRWRHESLPGGDVPAPVHRLGRGTSGVLLCAKSSSARTLLSASFAAATTSGLQDKTSPSYHLIRKTYCALASGLIQPDSVEVTVPIGLVPYRGVKEGLHAATPTGRPARSRVRVVERFPRGDGKSPGVCTLVEVDLYTGRPHQIRIHLAAIGHPLLGDPLYAPGGLPQAAPTNENNATLIDVDGGRPREGQAMPGDCGYTLHCYRLRFNHPITNEELLVEAPLPPALTQLRR